jgi:antagonist of KipI
MAALKIVRPGLLTTVQDSGRWGFQSRGVPVSGAMDGYSHQLANMLAGNDNDAATLEVTLLGPQIEFDAPVSFAVAGAEFRLTLDETEVPMNARVEARPGSCLRFGERMRGSRAYLAIGGGIDVPMVLNSRSTHIVSALGGYLGRALRAGDVVPIAEKKAPGVLFQTDGVRGSLAPFLPQAGARVRVIAGADGDQLAGKRYIVSTRSDRMGYRLEGPSLSTGRRSEMISSAVPAGAIQVPPGGQPILLMADRATVGGYPVAATVITADLPVAGQLAPGDWIEFAACSFEAADLALRDRSRALGGGAW